MWRFLLVGVFVACAVTTVTAKEVKIAMSNLPPHADEKGKGREADIIRAVLEDCGRHTVVFKVMPFTRHWLAYKQGGYDGVTTVPPGMELPGHASTLYIAYQNGASFLTASTLKVNALEDLAGKRVMAFKAALTILPGLKAIQPKLQSYSEQANQESHSKMLFARRVDVVLADGLIFAEYNRQLTEQAKQGKLLALVDPSQPVTFRAIFPPSPYVMIFKDKAVQATFDRCFKELTGRGVIAAINTRYVEIYRDTVGEQYLGY